MVLKHGFEVLTEEGAVRDSELDKLTAAAKLIHEAGGMNANVPIWLASKVKVKTLEMNQRTNTVECSRSDGVGSEWAKRPGQLKFNCCGDMSVRQVEVRKLWKALSGSRWKQRG
jgi:hypothetical protein